MALKPLLLFLEHFFGDDLPGNRRSVGRRKPVRAESLVVDASTTPDLVRIRSSDAAQHERRTCQSNIIAESRTKSLCAPNRTLHEFHPLRRALLRSGSIGTFYQRRRVGAEDSRGLAIAPEQGIAAPDCRKSSSTYPVDSKLGVPLCTSRGT